MATLPTAYVTRRREGQHTDELAILGPDPDGGERMLAYSDLPTPATPDDADEALQRLGYRRTSPWQAWVQRGLSARVEPIPARGDGEPLTGA